MGNYTHYVHRRHDGRIAQSEGPAENQLVAAIVLQAITDWENPPHDAFELICMGDPPSHRPPCPDGWRCFRGGNRGEQWLACEQRTAALRRELVQFFWSDWLETLLGPEYATALRDKLQVPPLEDGTRRRRLGKSEPRTVSSCYNGEIT
jgi:hypothetical protein